MPEEQRRVQMGRVQFTLELGWTLKRSAPDRRKPSKSGTETKVGCAPLSLLSSSCLCTAGCLGRNESGDEA